jgi:two-component system sensor histidine kinase KdpD
MLDRLEGIRRGVDRLRAMVAELLDVALIGAGRLQEQLTYQTVDLRQLVREALALEERTLANHPVRLELPETFPLVRVDRRRILSAIRNLLSNAGRYTPPGTEIVVRLDHYDGWVKLAVTDRGPGLRPEELPRLFNRFWRARVARGGVTYGLGLGLYINREVVRAHGGEMGAESAPGRGSTFWFRLPVATEGAD